MTTRIRPNTGVDPGLVVEPWGLCVVFTVSELTAGEGLLTPRTRQEINHPPDAPVDIPPRLQLTLQLQQVIVHVEVLVPHVTER